jgi:Kef-type K+ transport system membrane component KefB/nucleotide-binding universal stress UspA family protein
MTVAFELSLSASFLLAVNMHSDTSVIVFIAEIALMLVVGRALGELMLRIRQPEVLGQLLAGILLGPTILGNFWPATYGLLFPATPDLKKMIDGVSQTGVLMLLLLAGMEIDFALVRRKKRTAFFSSLSGIVLPFGCGLILGYLLPVSLLPAPEKRLLTALFLATALSISSIKIVAMVLMEVDFMRRNLGQLILASAIIDDTIGWIIVAIISGIAAEGALDFKSVGLATGGTLVFVGLSFTIGRPLITHIIRWTNDTLNIEFSVLSVILVLMFAMAIATDLIGVHTVLGAFVMGMLVGQSPMMTDHIREQLRGVVVAFFAPVFFAVAGLNVDLTILRELSMLKLAVGLILIASFGKLVGCFVGARLGSLTARESLALAIGMNARGTTEVIVATIGLSIGVLTRDFYTLIVIMAITTTMVMPPMLRWALGRIPVSRAEKERMEKEAAQASDFVPKVERLLIAADQSDSGRLAALLSGLFVGSRKIIATVLDLADATNSSAVAGTEATSIEDSVKTAIKKARRSGRKQVRQGTKSEEPAAPSAQLTTLISQDEPTAAILKEMKNGYDLVFVGLEHALAIDANTAGLLNSSIEPAIRELKKPMAIAVFRSEIRPAAKVGSMNILVPTTGTNYSRLAAEVAIAIAKASGAGITALNVSPPPEQSGFIRNPREHLKPGRAVLNDIKNLGKREGVSVKTLAAIRRAAEPAILHQITKGRHNLLVLGANVRPGEGLFFGHSIVVLLQKTSCSLLVVSS